jgi:caa(3)-type oxidase subunit IV
MAHPVWRYFATWLALVALAAASLGLSFLPLGGWAVPVAMAIAGVKGLLVAAVFMHLAEEPFVHSLALGAAVGLLLLLAGFTAADVATRVAG